MGRLDDSVMIAATKEYVAQGGFLESPLVTVALLIIAYLQVLLIIGYLLFYFKTHKALNFPFWLQQQLGLNLTYFGEKYDKFWPCANGLISFNGQVRAGEVRRRTDGDVGEYQIVSVNSTSAL